MNRLAVLAVAAALIAPIAASPAYANTLKSTRLADGMWEFNVRLDTAAHTAVIESFGVEFPAAPYLVSPGAATTIVSPERVWIITESGNFSTIIAGGKSSSISCQKFR
jgi:hypothetical protein